MTKVSGGMVTKARRQTRLLCRGRRMGGGSGVEREKKNACPLGAAKRHGIVADIPVAAVLWPA